MGSRNHTITAYESAVSATHIALVSILAIPTSLLAFAQVRETSDPPPSLWEDSLPTMGMYDTGIQSARQAKVSEENGFFVPHKFSSETDRCGRDSVGAMPILEWEQHKQDASYLVDKCESLYQTFLKLERNDKEKDNDTNGIDRL